MRCTPRVSSKSHLGDASPYHQGVSFSAPRPDRHDWSNQACFSRNISRLCCFLCGHLLQVLSNSHSLGREWVRNLFVYVSSILRFLLWSIKSTGQLTHLSCVQGLPFRLGISQLLTQKFYLTSTYSSKCLRLHWLSLCILHGHLTALKIG